MGQAEGEAEEGRETTKEGGQLHSKAAQAVQHLEQRAWKCCAPLHGCILELGHATARPDMGTDWHCWS